MAYLSRWQQQKASRQPPAAHFPMNALEDRLVEYLNSLEPAVPAPSLRRVDKVDTRFIQAGLSPYLNLKGAIMQPVQPPENPVPMRVRICSHVTQAKFLHIEDSLGMGKLRLFAGTYRKGNGMTVNGHAQHFLNVEDARVVFHALAMAEPNFAYKEYKGTAQPDGKVVSRVLSVTSKGDQVYIELKTGPGTKTPTGAVTPNGKAEVEVNVAFKTYEARRLGQTVLAYIQAWDILRLMAHRNLLGKMAAYELVPTTSRNRTNNHQMQATQATANGATSRGVPAPHKSVNGKQSLADRQNAAASPPLVKPVQTNGSGVTQIVKGQTPAPVAAAKTPPPQVMKPASRVQHPAIAKTQATNAAATTPAVEPTQVNKPGINPSRQEQTVIPDTTAEQPGPSLAENSPEEPQPAVKGEIEPANAAAIPRIEETVQAVNGEQRPDRKMETATDAAAPIPTPQASQRPMANGQPPTRPLTRRGPTGRTMPEKRASAMPPVVKQHAPIAAAIPVIPTAPVSPPNPIVQQTGQSRPKTTAMAEALYGIDEQPLRYRNGVLVDRTNAAEVEAFRHYQAEKQGAPLSRPQLRTYMRQKLAV